MYKWNQTTEIITITIKISETFDRTKLKINVKPDFIEIAIDGNYLCKGFLYDAIYQDYIWYIDNYILFVELEKVNQNFQDANWPKLFKDNEDVKCSNNSIKTTFDNLPLDLKNQYLRFIRNLN